MHRYTDGRVELFLEKHSPVISTALKDFSSLEDIPLQLPPSSTSSSETTKQLRPTYVPIPRPRSFEMDAHPTSASNISNLSSQSSSPLATFDSSYTRGSPTASSPAINVEQGLPVLVVDDDQLTRTLMKRILTRLGCSVSTAENGEMALEMILGTKVQHALTPSSDATGHLGPILEHEQELELAEENKYAVVFLDNQMPVMSGLKAVEKLRQMGRRDLIVGVTGKPYKWMILLFD
jgi:osomolarity two-component system, sensor histidine kinase SLN1